tara:strand:- start:186 stop:1217 length:1032 start_codon:yes stop_codon:yes gene_type:complete
MKKVTNLISINLILTLFFILIFEFVLGHWFKEDHFGYHMRGKRLQKVNYFVNYDNIKKDWVYRRDYYGFREDFDFKNKYDLKKIKVVFTGGSTGDEMVLPYKETIVGNLNKFLIDDNLNIKIFNASLSGKSLTGNINDFEVWFNKLKGFNPEIMIFYLGLNDRIISKNKWHDNNYAISKKDYIISSISQKSFFWELLKKIKDSYFTTKRDGHQIYHKVEFDEKFVSYAKAKKIYKDVTHEEREVLSNYKNKLEKLKDILTKKKITPVFITQIKYNGNGERILFYLNEEIKKFSLVNNYSYIALDELLDAPINQLFIDNVHTNKEGSNFIAKKIYPSLRKLLTK